MRTAPGLASLLLLVCSSWASAGLYALDFDGVDDWVSFSSSPLVAGDPALGFTFEAWILARSAESGLPPDIVFYNGPMIEFSVGVLEDPGIGFGVKFANSGWSDIAVPHPLGAWTHLAAVYDRPGNETRLYIDGTLRQTTTTPAEEGVNWFGVGIGTYPPTLEYSRWLNGRIDAIRISEGVRYAADFTPPQDFADDAATLALWTMEAGTGSELPDDSGNGFVGEIYGATWVQLDAPVATSSSSWSSIRSLY